MTIYRNSAGDVLDVPAELEAFAAEHGFTPDNDAPSAPVVAAPSPAGPSTSSPAPGTNNSEGVTTNG